MVKRALVKKILIALAAIVVIFLVVVATRPADFRVERTATLAAPMPVVFEQVNDLHKWDAWSPWAKLDPAMKSTFSGPPAGTGAAHHWVGNSEVGEGRMTITESRPNELVRMKLEFIEPFAATNTAEFTFKPDGDRTTITWSMSGHNGFMAKAFCMFMDMDKMVGGQFEQGLSNMKSVVEVANR